MRKLSFLLLNLFAFVGISFAQEYIWNGAVSTDYQVAANWTPSRIAPSISDTLSFNAAVAVNVTNVANQIVGAIRVLSGTGAVTLSTNLPNNILTVANTIPLIYTAAGKILAGDFLTIQLSAVSSFSISAGVFGLAAGRGGKIRINGALTLAGGTLDVDVASTGGTTINGPSGSITYRSGVFLCTRASSITWGSGSNYYHAVDGTSASAIPAATWQTGSTCNVTGMDAGAIAPTGLRNINFSNFTWNCAEQNQDINLLPTASVLNIRGIFTIAATGLGTRELRVSTGKAAVRATTYAQTGGTLTLQSGTDTTTLGISGNFSHTNGVLNGVGGSGAGTAILDLKGNVSRETDATWQSDGSSTASQIIFQFSGNAVQAVNVSQGAWNAPVAGRCNIVNTNKDVINGINLAGTLRVFNTNSSAAATFTTTAVITGDGNVTYMGAGTGGTTLIYNATFLQTASDIEFPVSDGPFNLYINNTLGVSFPAGFNRSIAGRLSMQSGDLAIGSGNTLSLTATSLNNQLTYTGGFITTGTLGRYFPISGLPTAPGPNALFPFGAGVNSRFLNIYFSAAALIGGTAGMIYVSHSPIVGVTPISLADNNAAPITLDKRTNTNWAVSTGDFNLGGGGRTVSITAVGANIGSVNNYTFLRLTDGVTPNFGTLIPTTGTNAIPTVGKSGLVQGDLNKTLYVGGDNRNPLIIITYTWTGQGGNNRWTTAANWTGGPGYPSSSTEIAVINSTTGGQPIINTGTSINIYQLTVGAGMTLTMAASSGLYVYDSIPDFSGNALFAAASTFGYASSYNPQRLISLPYGNLAVSGTANKILPAIITVRGDYIISGAVPVVTGNTFIYAGDGAQRITATSYNNLVISGDRNNALITLGTAQSDNVIDIKNVFNVNGLSNYSTRTDFNVVRFSSPGAQTIPGFLYGQIANTGGTRILDPLGSTDSTHVITCRSLNRSGSVTPYIVNNSKVKFYVSGTVDAVYLGGNYYDIELSGNLNDHLLDFFNGTRLLIAGKFDVTLTNFRQGTNIYDFYFNGAGNQTITAFKPDPGTNTPAFKYSNIYIAGGNRNVTLAGDGTDTIGITDNLLPETNALTGTAVLFAAGKGFIVTGSTVDFSRNGSVIPVLKPAAANGNNYNNIVVSSGTRILGGTMVIGGDVNVLGDDPASATTLYASAGSVIRILGNLFITGSESMRQQLKTRPLNLKPIKAKN